MYFAKARSKVVHSGPVCRKSRVIDALPVILTDNMRLCKHCFANMNVICFICQDEQENTIKCPCSTHRICSACLDNYIDTKLQDPGWNFEVGCPCGMGGAFPQCVLSEKSKLLIESAQKKTDACYYRRFHLDVAIDKIMTLRCPHCESAFDTFDACLSVQCRCKKFFCALCFKKYDTSRSCHDHVLKCNSGSHWMQLENWKRFQHDRICVRLWMFLYDTMIETDSTIYPCFLGMQLNAFDCAMLPMNRFSRCIVRILLFAGASLMLMHPIACLCAVLCTRRILKLAHSCGFLTSGFLRSITPRGQC